MKIAFVSQPWNRLVPPVQTGSAAIWTYEVARRLAPSYDVMIYSRGGRSDPANASRSRVQFRYFWLGPDVRVEKLLDRVARVRGPRLPSMARWYYYLGYILRVALDLRQQNCDVVHVHNFSQFVPVIRAFNPTVKIVLHMHCEWLTQFDRRAITRRLQKTDRILGCSEYITEKIRQCYGQFAHRCGTVLNGVDVGRFGEERRRKRAGRRDGRILFVGRISPEKGLHVLLEAFALVQKERPEAALEVIGSFAPLPSEMLNSLTNDPRGASLHELGKIDYAEYLQERLTPETIDFIRFVGAIPHDDLVSRYADADLFVSPALSDAFPLTVAEAMASGVPVVATRVGGVPEAVVENETGVLVEPGDPAAMAREVCRLLGDRKLLESMGKAARERAIERFSWDRIVESLVEQYCSL
ncbi:MAG TPA: glycosyltransferase family 4 protein [Planctomycetota bacterium]|nr:glycosyltransferase family 4 protein [Planctomycetota bacterium]